MSTNGVHSGSGSIISTQSAFTHTGSPRPARPGQLDPAIADNIAGGADPAQVSEIAHATAWALLSHVHDCEDPVIVERVMTLVDREGVDTIAELWSHAEPDSLPGVLWRLYLFRTWMRAHPDDIARLWRLGEPVATAASAIAGVDDAPSAEDIARTADSILAGAFTGDFAVAMDRAATFIDVITLGLRVQAHRLTKRARSLADPTAGSPHDEPTAQASDALSSNPSHSADVYCLRTQAARLLHHAANLHVTAQDLRKAAHLWRRSRLE